MEPPKESFRPGGKAERKARRRLTLSGEFVLALLPTIVVLGAFGLIQSFSHQQLLFASLASSAFLIYLDPLHGTNSTRTLVMSQTTAAVVGFVVYWTLGGGYRSGGVAMVVIIIFMIVVDAVHPPAVSTALSFAFRAGPTSNLALFGLALIMVLSLVAIQRGTLWILTRYTTRTHAEVATPDPNSGGTSIGEPQRSGESSDAANEGARKPNRVREGRREQEFRVSTRRER